MADASARATDWRPRPPRPTLTRPDTVYGRVTMAASATGLVLLGGAHIDDGTILLLGPHPQTFWPALQASPHATAANPADAWSTEVIGSMARAFGAEARFPFGTPVQPFVTWALATGWCHISRVGLLVHETQGLMVSFRGALLFADRLDLPPPAPSRCDGCPAPCLDACPVGALTPQGYDLPACHGWLDDPANSCMARGCAVRRACPVSPPRPDAQSAHHMASFHHTERDTAP
ncbi:ferredoxin [Jannaschia pohangensis]|uniref:4Fe-4S ferredoxin-type domain-containing protein n=1 Tax=Jannaschia pohangensis TaxID=390807 RepID=A0A1I3ICW3_9RHOB|nr:ferredoxin [Jannaschia pohangensis]SFI45776.1 hypothetical protein SAMN04488095_0912 [Jannaschia pohangensis]